VWSTRGIIVAISSSMCSKTWFMIITAANVLFIGMMVKLLDRITNQAPLGYEDESGFHFGNRNS
jgi:hypothetical protein